MELETIVDYVKSILPNSPTKYIVDVGANESAAFSAPFISQGYSTLLIEPQAACITKLSQIYDQQSNVRIIQKACSDHQQDLKIYHGRHGDTQVATLNTSSDPWLDIVRSDSYEMVQCDTLTNILDEIQWPKQFDILKIDAETWDPMVIKGLDFSKYTPNIIVTEEYYWEPENLIGKYAKLEDNGYVLMGFVGYNSIWKKCDENTRYVHQILRDFIKIHGLDNTYPTSSLEQRGRW